MCQNNAVLFGLQTLQGEFLKSFLLLLCEKKKKSSPITFLLISSFVSLLFGWFVYEISHFGSKLFDSVPLNMC